MDKENLIYAFVVDKDGFIVGAELITKGLESESKYVTKDFSEEVNLVRPKWNGEEWIEGATQEEIEELSKVDSPQPTIEQRASDLEDIVNMILTGGI